MPSLGGPLDRRQFLELLGASAALAAARGCAIDPGADLPYARTPPEYAPGEALTYATSMELGGHGVGLVVTSRGGRPIYIDGNPAHPASLGAAGLYATASLLGLYDPDRAARTTVGGHESTVPEALGDLVRAAGPYGENFAILMEPTSSPTALALLDEARGRRIGLRTFVHAPLAPTPLEDADDRPIAPQYDFRAAAVVLAADADFLDDGPFHLRHARQFAERRRDVAGGMNRLYVVEPLPTPTGALADHRLALRAGDVAALLAQVLAAVMDGGAGSVPDATGLRAALGTPAGPAPQAWAAAVAADLLAHRGASAVVVGPRQPPLAHALAHVLNEALGNTGHTVWFTRPVVPAPAAGATLADLADAIRGRDVKALLILGGNPAYTSPGDLGFADLLGGLEASWYLAPYRNETAARCRWVIPAAHYLECWGDTRAYDGTVSLVQPLINPLTGGVSREAVLAPLANHRDADPYRLVKGHWREQWGPGHGPEADLAWDEIVQRGIVEGTAEPVVTAAPRTRAVLEAPPQPMRSGTIEIVFRRDAKVYDGRFANNAWLQELPEPITKLTWDNAVLVSPAAAKQLGAAAGDHVALTRAGRRIEAPALPVAGVAEGTVVLPLGYGRSGAEHVARGAGVSGFELMARGAPYTDVVTLARAPGHRDLAFTQVEVGLEGRRMVRQVALPVLQRDPDVAPEQRAPQPTLYHPHDYSTGDQWAMVVDLALCTGCSACVVACQEENNVPVVGRSGVRKGRAMHWLRIDRYQPDDAPAGTALLQPMLCQHCEQAPCEYVCPVSATMHSDDGLNQMIYNRCVGTRFCSNNCPYKVRRFNWFDYTAGVPERERLAFNPEVTVRERGVMEKCTFCVQRIRTAQIAARVAGRALAPDEVHTACQDACPTSAIVFGSRTDPTAALAAGLSDGRRYAALYDLATRPRVTYLAHVTNPNPSVRA